MLPRSVIIIGLYTLLSLGAGLAFWGWLQLRSFLKTYDSIRSPIEFDAFKRVVKTNMYLALAIIVVFGLVLVLASTGIYGGMLGWMEVLVMVAITGPICSLVGIKITNVEKKMKAILLGDENLREEFDHVVRRWNSSPFPDW